MRVYRVVGSWTCFGSCSVLLRAMSAMMVRLGNEQLSGRRIWDSEDFPDFSVFGSRVGVRDRCDRASI